LQCVNTVDKELRGEFGVKTTDKGLTEEILKSDAERRANGVPPSRVFCEKRLQAVENKALKSRILAEEWTKRRQPLRIKGLGMFRDPKVGGLTQYFMLYYTI
jgi:hypothetical protein